MAGSAPKLRSIPALYPLPASALRGANLATAAVLLSLPAAGSYPPPPADPAAQRPFIDVSATTGQVYIVIEPSPARRGRRESIGAPGTPGTPTAAAARERTEWLVNIEFEVEVEASVGPDELFKVRGTRWGRSGTCECMLMSAGCRPRSQVSRQCRAVPHFTRRRGKQRRVYCHRTQSSPLTVFPLCWQSPRPWSIITFSSPPPRG